MLPKPMRVVTTLSPGMLLPLLVASLLAGCATKGDLDLVRRDMDETKNRVLATSKDLAGLRAEAREDISKNLKEFQKELAGMRDDLDTLRKGNADLQANLDSLRVDLQSMGGKVDDLGLAAKKPLDDLALVKEDNERRLGVVEDRLNKLDKGFAELQKGLSETRPKEPAATPESLYQQGLDAFKGGNPQKARDLLTRFVDQNPKHELAANARYWIGETYYSEKNYEQAILEFQQVITSFPNREKSAAALLKQAMAFKELNDPKSARYVLKKLLEEYPKSEEAKLAEEKLKSLK